MYNSYTRIRLAVIFHTEMLKKKIIIIIKIYYDFLLFRLFDSKPVLL